MTTEPTKAALAVTDADRRAAHAMLIGKPVGGSDGGTFVAHTPLPDELAKAFAAHRIAALEQAAKVADERADAYRAIPSPQLLNAARLGEAERIASQIRNLKGQP